MGAEKNVLKRMTLMRTTMVGISASSVERVSVKGIWI